MKEFFLKRKNIIIIFTLLFAFLISGFYLYPLLLSKNQPEVCRLNFDASGKAGNNWVYHVGNMVFGYCPGIKVSAAGLTLPMLGAPKGQNTESIPDVENLNLFFPVSTSSQDVIGLRSVVNTEYLSTAAWFQKTFPNSVNPQITMVDGYQGLRDERTVYVNVLDYNLSNHAVKPIIFILSYNDKAKPETIEIFNQLVQNWRFNLNLTSDNKEKLRRDFFRIYDLKAMINALENYKTLKGNYPSLQAGSYKNRMSVSLWPSWNSTLAQEIGVSLPIDPLNQFASGSCAGSPISTTNTNYLWQNTCYNPTSKIFECHVGSQVYKYSFIPPASYKLFANFEIVEGLLGDPFRRSSEGVLSAQQDCWNFVYQPGASASAMPEDSASCGNESGCQPDEKCENNLCVAKAGESCSNRNCENGWACDNFSKTCIAYSDYDTRIDCENNGGCLGANGCTKKVAGTTCDLPKENDRCSTSDDCIGSTAYLVCDVSKKCKPYSFYTTKASCEGVGGCWRNLICNQKTSDGSCASINPGDSCNSAADCGGGDSELVCGDNQKCVMLWSLTVDKEGSGSGSVTGGGLNCGANFPCVEHYPDNASVTLTASPASDSTFTGWSGACSGNGSCTVTMDEAKTVAANFALPTYELSVTKSGSGSGAIPSMNCLNNECSKNYDANTVVNLAAVPDPGSTFTGWSGGICCGAGNCQITMNAAKHVTATFAVDGPYSGTIVSAGSLGANTVIQSMVVYNCQLYAAGNIDGKVYRYDGGTSWTSVGQLGPNTNVRALAVYNTRLYGAGNNNGTIYLYENDGANWTSVGKIGVGNSVAALAVYNNQLYATGDCSVRNVFRYAGNNVWTSTGFSGGCTNNLVLYDNKLCVGSYTSAQISCYNGSTWTKISGNDIAGASNIYAAITYKNQLYAGVYNVPIQRYDGSGTTWSAVGGLPTGDSGVVSFAIYNGRLYAGGRTMGKVYLYDNASSWPALPSLSNVTQVASLTVYNGKLYAAGSGSPAIVYAIY